MWMNFEEDSTFNVEIQHDHVNVGVSTHLEQIL
jgi:hypothetical protein